MMDSFLTAISPLQGIILAFALGFLIGIERGWSHRQEVAGSRVAGIRTFALLGLAGGMAGEAARHISPFMAAIIIAAAAGALLIGYWQSSKQPNQVSATATIVGIITLGIGVFAGSGQSVIASVLAVGVTVILSLRRQLHSKINQMSEAEVRAIAYFALISIAILPLLPDQFYGPYDAWNPYQLWIVVVLVSGLSFAGYIASKYFGVSRGLLITAAAGALVSSTAVTAALATQLRKKEISSSVLVAGITMASAVLLTRMLVLTAVLLPSALPALLWLVGVPALFNLGYTAWLFHKQTDTCLVNVDSFQLRNPFDLRPALLLAALVMALSLLSRWMMDLYGDAGLATILTISGVMDADSALITMHGLTEGSIEGKTAALILTAAVMANTLFKAGLAVSIAGFSAGWRAAIPLVLSVVIALFAWLVP